MRKRWIKITIGAILLVGLIIGGVFIVRDLNMPDTAAFQDKFTRDFLVKNADTPDGFHLFESGIGKYTILIPEDYYMAESSYWTQRGKKSGELNTENVYLKKQGVSPKENLMIQGVKLFLKPDVKPALDGRLLGFRHRKDIPEDIEFIEKRFENKTLYYLEYIYDYEESGSINTYFFVYGLIVDNHSKQGIYFEFKNACFESNTKDCPINFEKQKKLGITMMESVKFKK